MNLSEPRNWKYNRKCSMRAVEEWETILKQTSALSPMPPRLVPFLMFACDVAEPVYFLQYLEEYNAGSPDFLPLLFAINGGSRMLLANIGLEE